MNKFLLGFAAAGVLAFGAANVTPALAGPTADQAAAESDLPTAAPPPVAANAGMSSRGQGVIVPAEPTTGSADASNGLAQSRTVGGQELRQNGE